MKILFTCNTGTMRHSMEIHRAVAANLSGELTVVSPEQVAVERVYDPSGWLRLEGERECDGYRMVPVALANPRSRRRGFKVKPLLQIIRQSQPDIIHVWDEPLSQGLFRVAWIRCLVSHRSRVLFYGFQNILSQWGLLRRIEWGPTWTQVAGGAVANSEALENLKEAGFPKGRHLERIFLGISTNLFRPLNKYALRRDLGIEYDHVVGYVGRLLPEKGLTWLLDAIERLPGSIHCLIIGSGPMRAELEWRSSGPVLAGRVHLIDARPAEEIPKYLNCMDVLVVPSMTRSYWKEQYGRVIGEAMACGVPVIGSDSGAIPEVIDSAGLVVREGDVTALAEAIRAVVFDEGMRESLKRLAMERAERELSVTAMACRLMDFYSRVLEA